MERKDWLVWAAVGTITMFVVGAGVFAAGYSLGAAAGYSSGYSHGFPAGFAQAYFEILTASGTKIELAPNASAVWQIILVPPGGQGTVSVSYEYQVEPDNFSKVSTSEMARLTLGGTPPTSTSTGWLSGNPLEGGTLSLHVNSSSPPRYLMLQADPTNPGSCVVFLDGDLEVTFTAD